MINVMKCPFCKKGLKNGPYKEYETLTDHVSNPNARSYPLRPTFVCDCPQTEGKFWNGHGYGYGTARDAIGSGVHKIHTIQNFARKIHPLFLRAKYPYDKSYQIARLLVNPIWPILLLKSIIKGEENYDPAIP